MPATETHRSERLRLRPAGAADAPAIARLLKNDPEAVRMTERMPTPFSEAAARDWLAAAQAPEGAYLYALEHAQSGAFLGCAGYALADGDAVIGYWLGRPFWNQGFAAEAVGKIVELARQSGARQVVADSFPKNAPSQRVLEKLGFAASEEVEKDIPERGGRCRLKRFVLAL